MGPRFKVTTHNINGVDSWVIIDTLNGDRPCRDKSRHIRTFRLMNAAVKACERMNQGDAEWNDPNHPFNAGVEGEQTDGPAQTEEQTGVPEVSTPVDRDDC